MAMSMRGYGFTVLRYDSTVVGRSWQLFNHGYDRCHLRTTEDLQDYDTVQTVKNVITNATKLADQCWREAVQFLGGS